LLLHVRTYFVRDHIGSGEIAGRTEAVLQFLKKRDVQRHFLIARTIERPHRGGCGTANGIHATAEQFKFGIGIGFAVRREDVTPGCFGRTTSLADKLLLLRIDLCRYPILRGRIGLSTILIQQRQRVLEEHPANDGEHHNGAKTHAAATATIDLDIAAAFTFLPIHRFLTDGQVRLGARRR
jgi:hypothetical protein